MIPTTCTGALVHPRHSTYCVHAQVSPYSPRNGIISECITGCYAPSIFILTLAVLLVARVWPWERPRSTRFLRSHGETLRQSTEYMPKNVLSPNNTPNSWAIMPCLLVSLRKLIPGRASFVPNLSSRAFRPSGHVSKRTLPSCGVLGREIV